MANQDNLINEIAGLDFQTIRNNLKTFLQSQNRFADYDFEGSNLAVLLDLLAYNTFYNAFYLNMVGSEMFLSTATKRSTVVARAKEIGYVPKSKRSATAVVDLTLTYTGVGTPATISVPANLTFSAEISGERYTFQTDRVYTATRIGTTSQYLAEDVTLIEGKLLTHEFTVTADDIVPGFLIPNAGVDTSRLTVEVRTSAGSGDDLTYSNASTIVDITGTSLVYFVSEVENEKHRVYFGDDILGKALVAGNVVTVSYYISSGEAPNGASSFSMTGTVTDVSSVAITVVSAAAGGEEIETIDSIKLNAPSFYQTQDRAITAADYVSVVNKIFSGLDSVTAWGGEDNDPIALGYVFISVKPEGRATLTAAEKSQIETELRDNYCPITIAPVIVDPDYLYIKPTVTVKFDPTIATDGGATIRTEVIDTIEEFGQQDLESFGEYLRHSVLVKRIDNTNVGITNSLTDVRIERRFATSVSAYTDYNVEFFNAVDEDSVKTDDFSITLDSTYPASYLKDDGTGNLQLCRLNNNVEEVIATHVLKMSAVTSTAWTTGDEVFQGGSYGAATGKGTIVKFVQVSGTENYLFIKSVTGTFAAGTLKEASGGVATGVEGTFERYKPLGDVDYDTGEMNLYSFKPNLTQSGVSEETIYLHAEPTAYDVLPVRNVILTIDPDDIVVSVAADSIPT